VLASLVQIISQPTRVVTNSTGMKSSTYIDHIFTKAVEMCFKAVLKSIGCSDHNTVAISRKTNISKAVPSSV
jgi:endonuclease/exonuclease/phosphatase (EEP) superfamily protein YafD